MANELKRAVHNLIHAASDPEEAAQEIAYWFPEGEFCKYKTTAEEVMFWGERDATISALWFPQCGGIS